MYRKDEFFMNNISENSQSDILLEKIFTITQDLYKEMSRPAEDSSDSHAAIFKLLTDLGRNLVNADRASFWKWDKRAHELWTTAAVGTGRIIIPEGTGLVGKALTEQRAIVTNDPYNHPDFNSDEDCRRLSLAAFICGITLESETFLDDSHHDKLTDLKNRMGFYNDYSKNYSKILNDPNAVRCVSLFICDIDFFKKVNDTYGHNAGDAVLKHVAKNISRNGIARQETRICCT